MAEHLGMPEPADEEHLDPIDALDGTDDDDAVDMDATLEAGAPRTRSWRQAWHLPLLLLSLGLLAMAIHAAVPANEPDRFDEALDEIAQALADGRLSRAQQRLERIRRPLAKRGGKAHQARSWLLWGELIYQQDRINRWSNPDNYLKVHDYFRRAVDAGAQPTPQQVERWAEVLVGLDRYEQAMRILEKLPQERARRRPAVLRRIIERRIEVDAKAEELYPLLADFERSLAALTDPQDIRTQRLWAARTRAELILGQRSIDAPVQAARYLERMLPRFTARGPEPDVAPLKLLLAEAYRGEGRFEDALTRYRSAQALLEPHDALNARILVGLGEVALAGGGDGEEGDPLELAYQHFRKATEGHPTTEAFIDALIGRAHAEALMGRDAEALSHFTAAVAELGRTDRVPQATLERLQQRLLAHHQRHYEREDYEQALAYIEKVKPLHDESMPDAILARLGATYEHIGREKLADAQAAARRARDRDVAEAEGAAATEMDRLTELRRALNREAAQAFEWAGDALMQYAQSALDAARVADSRDALWRAAENFDRAQRWDKAISAYQRFASDHGEDPRHLEARHRIGMAFLALGQPADVAVARDQFSHLIDSQRDQTSPAVMRSYVPLARAYLALDRPEKAQRRLLEVLNHRNITPRSDVYREALIELCKLHYQQGDYVEAIERLTEATDPRRYGEDAAGPRLRYMLASSLRKSVRGIDRDLQRAMQDSRRRELDALRQQRLEEAADLYARVIDELAPVRDLDPTMLSALEHEYLRNALIHRADCIYDLGRYREAIDLYSTAAADASWNQHPGMLVPLVQIVNAYMALGEPEHARSANRRAMDFLESVPDEAFEDPNLPMDRRHWQQWLQSNDQLSQLRRREAQR